MWHLILHFICWKSCNKTKCCRSYLKFPSQLISSRISFCNKANNFSLPFSTSNLLQMLKAFLQCTVLVVLQVSTEGHFHSKGFLCLPLKLLQDAIYHHKEKVFIKSTKGKTPGEDKDGHIGTNSIEFEMHLLLFFLPSFL